MLNDPLPHAFVQLNIHECDFKFNKSTEIGLAPYYGHGKIRFFCVSIRIGMEKRNKIANADERKKLACVEVVTTRYMNK